MGLGVGWLSGRLLWPATASGLFRQRAAAQLALCLENIRGGHAKIDGTFEFDDSLSGVLRFEGAREPSTFRHAAA